MDWDTGSSVAFIRFCCNIHEFSLFNLEFFSCMGVIWGYLFLKRWMHLFMPSTPFVSCPSVNVQTWFLVKKSTHFLQLFKCMNWGCTGFISFSLLVHHSMVCIVAVVRLWKTVHEPRSWIRLQHISLFLIIGINLLFLASSMCICLPWKPANLYF